jgi:RNA polymerase sigma factor (sigma-70 family)
MAKQALQGVLQQLRKVAAVQTYRGLSDGELLERFVCTQEDAAFTVLIERHGPMVLAVCRRALPDCHDAEDACQATFLVLARKGATIRKKTSLGSWLHGVACRVAANLKRDQARRKSRERGVAAPAPVDPAAEVSWREVQAILDEELERLPERARAPLILCYLECLTRDEAAQKLGLSPGALHGRLERARDLLRARLSKRGLTLAAVLSAGALGESLSQAALPPTFVVSLTQAAGLLAAGHSLPDGLVAANVLTLTQEVLKNMLMTKVKLGTAAVLCVGLCVILLGSSFTAPGNAQDTKPKGRNDQIMFLARSTAETDLEFIRRISKDLRGTDPTPAEIHFFTSSKEAGKRQKLIDLFIQERQAKTPDPVVRHRELDANTLATVIQRLHVRTVISLPADRAVTLGTLQKDFYQALRAAKEKGDVAKVTQTYLDRLVDFVKMSPKSPDAPEAIRQIILVYEAQGKAVEAGAWRDRLRQVERQTISGNPSPAKGK